MTKVHIFEKDGSTHIETRGSTQIEAGGSTYIRDSWEHTYLRKITVEYTYLRQIEVQVFETDGNTRL